MGRVSCRVPARALKNHDSQPWGRLWNHESLHRAALYCKRIYASNDQTL